MVRVIAHLRKQILLTGQKIADVIVDEDFRTAQDDLEAIACLATKRFVKWVNCWRS